VAMNNHAIIQELLEAVLSLQSYWRLHNEAKQDKLVNWAVSQ
jgi:hypothetical protein